MILEKQLSSTLKVASRDGFEVQVLLLLFPPSFI